MKRANWKQYGFEFLSIFIAVISAFALSNWNDNRRDHRAETKILTEIYNGLEKDLAANFQFSSGGHIAGVNLPLDLPSTDRSLLLSYLWKIKVNRNFILYYYRDVEQKVMALRAAIEAELAT